MKDHMDLVERYGVDPNEVKKITQDKVSDPLDLVERYGIDPSEYQSISSKSYLNKGAQGTLDFILGAGDQMRNFLGSIGNVTNAGLNKIPGVNLPQIPMAKSSEGLAYKTGNVAGEVGTFLGGGAGLNALRAGAEAVPLAGSIARSLGKEGLSGIGRRALGSGAYGALENPEERGKGAAMGAGISAALDVLPYGTGKVINQITPGRYSKEIMRGVASKLGESRQESKKLYQSVLKPFGDQPIILTGVNPTVFNKSPKLKEMYTTFKDNPTIGNAHKLQSQLYSTARDLKTPDVFSISRKEAYISEREKIKEAIQKTLSSKFPEAGQRYQEAASHFRENVVPFDITHKTLGKIVLPTPQKVAHRLEAVTKKEQYPSFKVGENEVPLVPKSIQQYQKGLNSRMRNKAIASKISGGLLGLGVAKHLDAGFLAELAAMGLGAGSAHILAKSGRTNLSKSDKSKFVKGISKLPETSKALIFNALYGESE